MLMEHEKSIVMIYECKLYIIIYCCMAMACDKQDLVIQRGEVYLI